MFDADICNRRRLYRSIGATRLENSVRPNNAALDLTDALRVAFAIF